MSVGDFIGDLFGGGDQTSTSVATPWEPQQEYLTTGFEQAAQNLQAGVPDISQGMDINQQAVQSLLGTAGQLPGQIAPAQAALQTVLDPNILSPTANPALQSYLNLTNQSITDQFMNTILPRLEGGAVGAGGVGGSRQDIIKAQGAEALGSALAQNAAQIGMGGYGQGLNALLSGLSQAPSITGLSLQPAQTLTAAGDIATQTELQPWQLSNQALQNYMQAVGGNYGGTTVTETEGGGASPFSQALGGLAAGAGIYNAFK